VSLGEGYRERRIGGTQLPQGDRHYVLATKLADPSFRDSIGLDLSHWAPRVHAAPALPGIARLGESSARSGSVARNGTVPGRVVDDNRAVVHKIFDDEPDTSESVVRALLASECPQWANLPVGLPQYVGSATLHVARRGRRRT
jgi:hypothetical protein